MNPEVYQAFVSELGKELAKSLTPHVVELIRSNSVHDPLLTASEAARHIGVSESTIRLLVQAGSLHRAEGIREIRIRRSILDAYGKPNAKRK